MELSKNLHWAIFIDNHSSKTDFLDELFHGTIPEEMAWLREKKGALFSKPQLLKMIDEEERHDRRLLAKNLSQPLRSLSSGEQKKALLAYVLRGNPHFLVLDSPFDNLDTQSQSELKVRLSKIAKKTNIVLLLNRRDDLLPFITHKYRLKGKNLVPEPTDALPVKERKVSLPPPLTSDPFKGSVLLQFKDVSVSFGNRPIVTNINWTIGPGEFWQLVGRNGSGKTTLLSMITGENSKGYGQELYIFDKKKGSGETIWDIKKNLGYFTPSMTDLFSGYHTVEHMVMSGLHDSVGLYVRPTETQLQLAQKWLRSIGMWERKNTLFLDLNMGEQRLVMLVRAMIKHPWLLILDEPTAGLDDEAASLFVELVNRISEENRTALLYVSHRKETGLRPQYVYELCMTDQGSIGKVI